MHFNGWHKLHLFLVDEGTANCTRFQERKVENVQIAWIGMDGLRMSQAKQKLCNLDIDFLLFNSKWLYPRIPWTEGRNWRCVHGLRENSDQSN
jgi:hypothetical protein